AGHDAARLGLNRRGARALAVADIAPRLPHRFARAVEPVALLHRDATDRLADGVLDDADAQRLQIVVELAGDPPLAQQLRRCGRIVGEELGEDWLWNRLWHRLRHRRHQRECSKEQQCPGASPGVEPATRAPRSRYIVRSHHDGSLDREPRADDGRGKEGIRGLTPDATALEQRLDWLVSGLSLSRT